MGDFNTQSQQCDPWCLERREAAYWQEIINNHGLVIVNDNWPTDNWTGIESEADSIIVLTLANQQLAKWTILEGSHAMGSDHMSIEWQVDKQKQEDAGATQVVRLNLAAISQGNTERAETLWKERAK